VSNELLDIADRPNAKMTDRRMDSSSYDDQVYGLLSTVSFCQ